ncbi:MAG: glycosyltransferase family 2 protein [Ignavibacteriales bacterium]|nr:glycosyltransferase family 2 protein [Ignavibacteriales bacterium]
MSPLSVIVITQNEEHNIRECLSTVTWAGEIIVVDSGSEDRTVERAREFTDRIFVRAWRGFGEARNFAIRQARGEWIFWLDADERITHLLAEEIRKTIESLSSLAAYSVPRKSFFLGKWIRHCGWYPGRVVRLFRQDKGRFTDEKVHERLNVDGTIGELKADLLHYTDPTLEHYFRKFNRYTSLAAEELGLNGKQFSLAKLISKPVWTFWRMYVLRLGFLDGLHGLILSVLSAGYVFTKYAKVWERSSTKESEE